MDVELRKQCREQRFTRMHHSSYACVLGNIYVLDIKNNLKDGLPRQLVSLSLVYTHTHTHINIPTNAHFHDAHTNILAHTHAYKRHSTLNSQTEKLKEFIRHA